MIELTRRTKHFQLAFIIIFITSFDTNLNCLLIKVEILFKFLVFNDLMHKFLERVNFT